jgi:hypothetical protein
MEPEQLDRFRRAIADDKTGRKVVELCDTLRKAKIDVTAREALKTAPKGYPKDHPRIDLLRHKSLYAGMRFEPVPEIRPYVAVAEGSLATAEARKVLPERIPPFTSASTLHALSDADGNRVWTRRKESCCFTYLLANGKGACATCPRRSRPLR